MNEAETDARLHALLAPPEEFADSIFTARVKRAILADEALRAARLRGWRRFGAELAGSLAVVLAFYVLGGADGAVTESGTIGFGPALAGLVLVAMWTLVALRPAPGR